MLGSVDLIQACRSKMLFIPTPPPPVSAAWCLTHCGIPIRVRPSPIQTGQTLNGLPHSLAEADWADLLPPLSSSAPILMAEGRALPTSCGVESDSLEARAGIAGPWHLMCDLCLCCSDATTAWCHPSTKGRGLTAK